MALAVSGPSYRWHAVALAGVLTLLSPLLAGMLRAEDNANVLHVGLLANLFNDVPQSTVRSSTESFKAYMKQQIERDGETLTLHDPYDLAEQIVQGKLQLGVFHGFEYGWVQEKYPKLTPLAIAVNQEKHPHIFVLAREDSEFKDFPSLKGKILALCGQSREESRVFLKRQCEKVNSEPKQFFSRLTSPPTLEDALDDVVDNEVQATVVDGVVLSRYRNRKPARFKKLRVVAESEVFPAPVIVYQAGALDDRFAARIRQALLGASGSEDGKQMLLTWKLTGFEGVPKEYEQLVNDIKKAYPPPKAER